MCLGSQPSWAGGGPENVVVLVNSRSAASKQIANFYVSLRDIPAGNVIYLDEVPEGESTDVETFRETILKPTIETINARRMAARIDYLVYSADFPTAVKIHADLENVDVEIPKVLTKTASINGLTYMAGWTMAKNPSYLSLDANGYASQTAEAALQRCYRGPVSKTCNKAMQAYRDDQFDEAFTQFSQLLEDNPSQPALHYWLARCEAQRDNWDAALESLDEAIRRGWCFRVFTSQDEAFAAGADELTFQTRLAAMPDTAWPQHPSREFRASLNWAPNGMPVASPQWGTRYFLSTVLAVTRGAGTTPAEAMANLQRSHDADFTQPRGRFCFTLTGDVRTRTRKPGFDSAIKELKRLGYNAEVIEGKLPENLNDVAGLMIGAANYQWAPTQSRILPGAICENLTSFGGKMDQRGGQTKLSELLRAGAAGSSGTVTEPYAIQAKFPHPSIQVHYAHGSSLAEAFYQSVSGPYQLLIVGDPLCQPWAVPPAFECTGLTAEQAVSGPVKCGLVATGETEIARYEIFMDGRFSGALLPGQPLTFQSTQLADGYHELRIVAIADNSLRTQARQIIPFTVDNRQQSLQLLRSGEGELKANGEVSLSVVSNLDVPIHVVHAGRELATVDAGNGEVTIACQTLGSETVRLQALAAVDGKPMYSEPLVLRIQAAEESPK
ncbi:tetratricopeptide repeat protein [Roseimaritima ulvae]|uniref:tetratricopeptide repeat protein n=1 Tax=Roseimaritima ulvae TaxID=980254 RepID=UPI00138FF840|nr:tetratricopeptide repeat protein [Roseimaritima ulvae]